MEKESNKNPELDLAPLSLAHEHARCASQATKTNNVPVARDQHVLAAGEFAKAAESAASLEALRTLKLLEDHHKHMSELIKDLPSRQTRKTSDEALEVISEKEPQVPSSAAVSKLQSDGKKASDKSDVAELSSPRRSPSKPTSQQRRPPSRELSSSIASNLATARGIRASHQRLPVSPSISAQHAPGSFEQPMRRDRHGNRIPSVPTSAPSPGKPSWVPPVNKNSASIQQAEAANSYAKKREDIPPKPKTTGDLGFERFYGMAEALMNKISAPLAYAGLPLNLGAEEPPNKSDSQSVKFESSRNGPDASSTQNSSPNEPDLTKYISKAALRAVGGGRDLVNDSFYVVPSTGLTTSYAGIMRHAEKERRREDESRTIGPDGIPKSPIEDGGDNEDNDEDDDFVDARETFSSPSMRVSAQSSLTNNMRRRFGRGGGIRQDYANTAAIAENSTGRSKSEKIVIEELEIKNEELRRVVDALTKRLHVFETSSQRSSLALHESIRYLGAATNSPVASVLGTGGGNANNDPSRTSSPSAITGRGDRTIAEDVVDAIKLKEMESRIRELEGEREGLGKEVDRERKEAERLRETVRKYREKWEVLKKGAKERRGLGTGVSAGVGSFGQGNEDVSGKGVSEMVKAARSSKGSREGTNDRKSVASDKDDGREGGGDRHGADAPGRFIAE